MNAGLDLDEYATAVRYEVTLDDWKKMHASRRAHTIAGWSCIALGGIVAPAVLLTLRYGGGLDWNNHPEKEVYIISAVAAGGAILGGIVALLAAPGPDDFKRAWMRQHGRASSSLTISPYPGGVVLGFTF
jgi:hypothetical protein